MSNHFERTGRCLRIPIDKTRSFPIAEPDTGTTFFITEQHVANGVSKDPWNCAIANSARETAGAVAAMIGSTIAYIVNRIDGETIALRYKVPTKTRAAIEHFDRTGEMPTGGFAFMPIPPSERSDSRRADKKRERKRWDEPRGNGKPTGMGSLRVRDVRNARHQVVTIAEPPKKPKRRAREPATANA